MPAKKNKEPKYDIFFLIIVIIGLLIIALLTISGQLAPPEVVIEPSTFGFSKF